MIDLERFADQFRRALPASIVAQDVSTLEGAYGSVSLVVVSPSFEGMDEGERQEIAWQSVLDHFDEPDRRLIGFIYTEAPSEVNEEPATVPAPLPADGSENRG